MNILPTPLPGALILEPRVFGDARGFFLETWNEQTFAAAGIDANFVQDNHSFSRRGTLRGLHYQLTQPQGKLVWVVAGEVLDVVVDLRRSSPTFGQWTSAVLSGENFRRMWVPPGFAHGFSVLSESAHFCYKCTAYYAPADERVILWNDPDLAIDWQIPSDLPPVLSGRDLAGQTLRTAAVYEHAAEIPGPPGI